MKICTQCKRRYSDDDVDTCPLDGARLEDVQHEWLGHTLEGGWVIEQVLTESGITAVFLARGAGAPVLVEALRGHLAKNPAMVTRFRRGVTRAAELDHPGIVRTLGQGTIDGVPYVVTEMLEGMPLARVAEPGPLAQHRAVSIGVSIARILEFAHGQGVIHRNIKPDNIFVSEDGVGLRATLKGFGIASAVDDERMTAAGEVFGTPGYLAPEQAASSEVSPQTDLYSLGVVLFELLTGEQPYEGDASHVLMIKHVSAPIPHVSEKVPCNAQLDQLIHHLMQKKPADRPQSAAAVRAALELVG